MHTISPFMMIHHNLFGSYYHFGAFYQNCVVAKSFLVLESVVEIAKNLICLQIVKNFTKFYKILLFQILCIGFHPLNIFNIFRMRYFHPGWLWFLINVVFGV